MTLFRQEPDDPKKNGVMQFVSEVFGLDSPLGLFPPGIDPGKLYNPLMEMSDPRGMPSDHPPPFLKGKKSK
ncbi:unnamed protein product [Ceratitis capitata]|uniref:(Mediterranean fruit fly) hypothetical protein n=1 Tax=Ceratitis capitata TaxID=7213 RepID=A0A811VBY2_CERCA|nr:unnamed protein product [Ceratitis capitata]